MSKIPGAPVVLELAPLPREQVGPFLLLGLEKTADKSAVEQNWADRLKWARRQLVKVSLEDINWAREILNDNDKRVRADAASLNLDSADGALRELGERFGSAATAAARCKPLDVEKNLEDYSPVVELPDLDTVRAGIVIPDVPEEMPAVHGILNKFLSEPIDPWNLPVHWPQANESES